MPNQNTFKLGNASILVESDEFADGHDNGLTSLEETQPLTVAAIRTILVEALNDTIEPADWNTGYVVGAIRGIYEGSPALWETEPEISSVQLGSLTLRLNRWRFSGGYYTGRQAYKMKQANRPSTRVVTATELLRSIACYDAETKQYTLAEAELSGLEDVLGQLVGYLCAALFPIATQEQDDVLTTGNTLTSGVPV